MTTQQIAEIIRNNSKQIFAIRADDGEHSDGDYMTNSQQTYDDMDAYELEGTCGTEINPGIYRDYADLSDDELLTNITKAIEYNKRYTLATGRPQCLIMGTGCQKGEDDNETIIVDAVFMGWL